MNVVVVELDRIEVAPGDTAVIEGETFEAEVTLWGPGGERLSARDVVWTTTNASVVSLSGAVGSRVGVTGLAPGRATVRAGAAGRTGELLVEVLVGPSLALSTDDVSLVWRQGDANPTVELAITNGGNGPISGLVTSVEYGSGPGGWLSVGLNGTTVPTTLTLTASGGGLAVGSYDATVRVASPSAGGLEAFVKVGFEVLPPPPAIELQSDEVALASTVGDPGAVFVDVAVDNGGSGALTGLSAEVRYPTGGPAGWLTATLSGTTAPATLRLSALAAGLQRGTYTAQVAVSSPVARVSPVFIDVTYTVRPPGSAPGRNQGPGS